jgi:aminopeptidase YwaD
MLRPALLLLLLTPIVLFAQKADQRVIKGLQADIAAVAGGAAENRAAGSEGERKTAAYLISRYEKLKIPAWGDAYLHPFKFVNGLDAGDTRIVLGGQPGLLGGEAFPLPFSGNGKVSGDVLIEVQELGAIWILPLYSSAEEAANPRFDWESAAWKQGKQAIRDGATGIVFYDNYGSTHAPQFNPLSKHEKLRIPMVFVGHRQWTDLTSADANMLSVTLDVKLSKPERSAANVIAWIDNKAAQSIVIGANYDQGRATGANDNASGTAALLQLAEGLKKARLRNYNIILAHFSGGRVGQAGAAAFIAEPGFEAGKITGMIDLYTIGQLGDSSLQFSPGAAFQAGLLREVLLQKSGFRETPFTERKGGTESGVFAKRGIPVISISGNNTNDQINYAAEARLIALLQNALKKMDAAVKRK